MQTLSRKDGEALQKFSEFDTGRQHFLLLYCKSCALLFAAKRGLLVHIKFVLLLPSSMAGSLIMASAHPLPRLAFFGDHSKEHDKQIKSTTTTILMSKDLKVGEGPLIWSGKEKNGKETKLDAHWIRSAKLLWVGSKGECMVRFQT